MDRKFNITDVANDNYIHIPNNTSESFPSLLKALIKIYVQKLPQRNKNNLIFLKKHLYSIIFSHKEDNALLHSVTNFEQLLWYSYTLRKRRKFDEANKLDKHLKYFQDKGPLFDDSVLQNILRLLICLTDNEMSNYAEQLATPAPWIISPKEVETLGLPSESLCYNETRWDCAPARWHYTHFSQGLFRIEESVLFTSNEALAWRREMLNACDKEPGTGHTFNLLREAEYDLSKSCLGALVGPKRIRSPLTPDTILTIPNLPSVPHEYSFIPFMRRSQEQSSTPSENYVNHENEMATVDEGYVSPHGSDSGKLPFKWDREDVWQDFPLPRGLKLPLKRYSWENALRLSSHMREKPFLSEAGAHVTQRLWSIEWLHISMIDPSMKLPSHLQMPSEAELCMQILYLLIGLPSSSFYITKDNSFKVKGGLCYKGSTPASLKPHLKELIECGEQILRLEEFCHASPTDEGEVSQSTLAQRSFKRPVRAFLFYYRQKVLLLKGETKFLSLKLRSTSLRRKAHYVFRLCRDGAEKKWFSSTLSLITGLKKELLLTQNTSNLCLLLSFVNAASKPFLVFLEKWLYEGEICSPEAEFLLLPDRDALQRRTRCYWTHGHRLCDQFAERVPDFLKGILAKVFLCGKSVNMLRVCFPQSFLLSKASEKHPTINLCSSLNQVHLAKLQCRKYAIDMALFSSQHVVTLSMSDEEQRRKEAHLVRIAFERHLEFLRSFKEKKNSAMLGEAEKKREALETLRDDAKRSKFWKEKRKEEEIREEEKAILEQTKFENQNEMEEQHQRATLMVHFDEQMGKLMCSEMALQRELNSLERCLYLNSVSEKDEMSWDPQEANENGRKTAETDNESVSGMSTASDVGSETPNDEAIREEFSDNKVEEVGTEVEDFTPNRLELNNNENNGREDQVTAATNWKEASPLRIDDSVVDELNRNALLNRIASSVIPEDPTSNTDFSDSFRTIEKGKQSTLCRRLSQDSKDRLTIQLLDKNRNKSPEVTVSEEAACETVERNSKNDLQETEKNNYLKNDAQETANAKGRSDTSAESAIGGEISDGIGGEIPRQSGLRTNTYDVLNQPLVDKNENAAIGIMTFSRRDDASTEKVRMRKSKSETSSLKDSVEKGNGTKQKMSQRMSLYNLHESDAPLLIDKAYDEFPHQDEIPRTPLFTRDQLEAIAASTTPPVVPYSIHSHGGRGVMDVASSFLNKCRSDPSPTDGVLDCADQTPGLPRPSQLSFALNYFARGIAEHLAVQSRLVNETLLSHFLVERNLLQHFRVLKDFLLLHDAAFAHALIPSLLRKFPPGHHLASLINPAEINGILNEAIALSTSPKSTFASNLTFVVKNTPSQVSTHPMDCIELRYMIDWPVCSILDDMVLAEYAALSKFLSRLRQVVWAIEDVFRYTMTIKPNSLQACERFLFHRLYIFRHEVQQFVRVLFGYICHQAIEGSWWVFQNNLRKVSTFDELYECHRHFVDDISEKCFLKSDTAFIQNQIQELFGEVLLFQSLTKNRGWQRTTSSSTAPSETSGLASIEALMVRFRKLSLQLNKTLQQSLLERGYSNHVEDLVVQMTFNDNFYLDSSVI